MSESPSTTFGDGATASVPASAPPDRPYKHPLLWVPTSYLAEGMVYVTITSMSNIMFLNMGLPIKEAAVYSSTLGLPYTLKPLWAPLLEMYKTKKFFVILMQVILAVALGCTALALKSPVWVPAALTLFTLCAFAGATQDIVTDGVYVTALPPSEQSKFTGFQSLFWSIGPILATGVFIRLSGTLYNATQSWSTAWMIVLLGIAALIGAIAINHSWALPQGAKAEGAPTNIADAVQTFVRAFISFFQKKGIWLMIAFAFFYRFGLGLLDKIGPAFIIAKRALTPEELQTIVARTGMTPEAATHAFTGLGLSNEVLGDLNGTVGTAAFMIASLLGGWFVSKAGLKKSTLLVLCLALNIPNLTFVYLSQTRPDSVTIIGTIIFLEKFGWGFGAVGHMLYMMQQIAPGPFKTAHYAFATAFLGFCMMTTGIVAGSLQDIVGFNTFFWFVMAGAIPSILVTLFAPFYHPTGEKKPA
jgi:PAT family beta-lactamase induction signal transducer AmpG